MFYVSDRFLRKDRVHGFPDLLLKFFFLEKNIAGKNKADGCVHSGAKESHGDGHCRRNNVIYATLEHTEYRIDHFTRINIKGLRPFNNFRIVSESIVYPFLKTGMFSSIFCRHLRSVAPNSGTTTSITITNTQSTKQMASTRLTGRDSFWAAFFFCFRTFPNK